MKAREFLARKVGEGVELRNVLKGPLSVEELRQLASRAGGVDELVAPKRRAEAEGLSGEKLLRWLAEDGARLRRPIVVTGKKVTLGFAESARKELEESL
ncbi:MAG TPA: ArsC/Spx/MgsR family protein [Myxococcales bacterium]|nr:ArsC/Spx/MgsR family protein [Myxococcales bacterium]